MIKLFKLFLKLILLFLISLIVINVFVIQTTKDKIIPASSLNITDVDCILVLGAGIRGNYPSPMLEDRLQQSISLYQQGFSSKILVSGDHINKDYDEVNVMKNYLVGHQIPSQDVFMDHAGISTYDSIYRAKEIFQAKKIIIVTQKYHLHRALYIAKKLNLESYGVSADPRTYSNQELRELREFFARIKDFFKCFLKPSSKYLGDPISLTGNGDLTNDKK